MSYLKVEFIRDGLGIGLENMLKFFAHNHPKAMIESTSHAFVYIPASETPNTSNPSREIHCYTIWYREEDKKS